MDLREHKRIKSMEKVNRRRNHLNNYQIKKGCIDCGYNKHPAALTWDHIDPSTKTYPVNQMLLSNLKKLFKEIRKCVVRCENCHRIRTIEEGHLTGRPRKNESE